MGSGSTKRRRKKCKKTKALKTDPQGISHLNLSNGGLARVREIDMDRMGVVSSNSATGNVKKKHLNRTEFHIPYIPQIAFQL